MSAGEGARIQSAAQSDVGRSRTENQDAFGEFTSAAGERLFVVADGMGGHRGGATASRLCVETLGRVFSESGLSGVDRLLRGFETANARVHRTAVSDPELSGMGTTAVALVLSPDGTATLGWVGDSRAYRFRDGALELLSSDHSVVGEMVRSGVLTPTEAESHPRKNELLRAIGPRPEVEAETRVLEHRLGDRFLLCTDGLWGPVADVELGAVLGYEAPDLAVRKLVGKANERGGPDNVTVQIACISELPVPAGRAGPTRTPVPAPRGASPSLPALVGTAAFVVAVLMGLAFYGLRSSPDAESSAAAEVTAAHAEAAPAAVAPIPAPRPPPPAAAPAVPQKPVAAPTTPKPEKTLAARKPKPAPAAAAPAPAPAPAAIPAPATEALASAAPAAPPTARAEVESFLADWERAISSGDFGQYSRLGLPGTEEAFRSSFVGNQAMLRFNLRSVEQGAPDELLARVRMVVERADTPRVDEEHTLYFRRTDAGLRFERAE